MNYKSLANRIHSLSESNDIRSVDRELNRLQLASKIKKKTYHDSNIDFYYMCVFLAFVAQLTTITSCVAFGVNFFTSLSPKSAYVLSLVILAFFEIGKYICSKTVFGAIYDLPKRNVNYLSLALLIVLTALTTVLSVIGGGELGVDKTAVVNTDNKYASQIDSISNAYQKDIDLQVQAIDQQLGTYRPQYQEIQTRYKGTTWRAKSDYIKEQSLLRAIEKLETKKTQIIEKVSANKSNDIALAKQKYANESNEINAKNEVASLQYRIFFWIFDVLFIVCTWYKYHFKKYQQIELELENEVHETKEEKVVEKVIIKEVVKEEPSNFDKEAVLENVSQPAIGFSIPVRKEVAKTLKTEEIRFIDVIREGSAKCAICGTPFTVNRKGHKYCSDNCRAKNHKQKKGA